MASSSVVGQTEGQRLILRVSDKFPLWRLGGGDTWPESRAREIVRRSLGALTVTTLLGAAVAVGAGLSWPGTVRATDGAPASAVPSPASRQPAAGPSASPTRAIVPTRTISPNPTTSPTPTQSASAPVGNPGIAITARPDPDGSFFVSEVITLPEAVTEVAVRPASIRDAGVGFERLRPMATNVELTAGGQALVVPDGPYHQRGDAALGRTHPTGAAALPAERGERRQRPCQARPHPGRIRLAARSDAGESARHRRGDGQGGAVAHLPAALTGHNGLRCR